MRVSRNKSFVQRPAIPPRPRRVTSRSPLEITAEYRAIVRQRNQRRGGQQWGYLILNQA